MPSLQEPTADFWIVGYGNSHRRDDGIGPYILDRLQTFIENRRDVSLLSLPQLAPEVADTLKHAGLLVFVDATVAELKEGRQWIRIYPEAGDISYLTHQVTPSFVLWLLQCLYQCRPTAWMVSVQGDDYGFGGGLSGATRLRALHVMSEIIEFILTYLPKKDTITSFPTEEKRNRRPK